MQTVLEFFRRHDGAASLCNGRGWRRIAEHLRQRFMWTCIFVWTDAQQCSNCPWTANSSLLRVQRFFHALLRVRDGEKDACQVPHGYCDMQQPALLKGVLTMLSKKVISPRAELKARYDSQCCRGEIVEAFAGWSVSRWATLSPSQSDWVLTCWRLVRFRRASRTCVPPS